MSWRWLCRFRHRWRRIGIHGPLLRTLWRCSRCKLEELRADPPPLHPDAELRVVRAWDPGAAGGDLSVSALVRIPAAGELQVVRILE